MGKTSVAFEVSERLEAREVPHAFIDVEDHIIDTSGRTVGDVAVQVLRRCGWPGASI